MSDLSNMCWLAVFWAILIPTTAWRRQRVRRWVCSCVVWNTGGLCTANHRRVQGSNSVVLHSCLVILSRVFLDLRSVVCILALSRLDEGGRWGLKCNVSDESFCNLSHCLRWNDPIPHNALDKRLQRDRQVVLDYLVFRSDGCEHQFCHLFWHETGCWQLRRAQGFDDWSEA